MTTKDLAEIVLRACVREMESPSAFLYPDVNGMESVPVNAIEDALIESGACTREDISAWGRDEEQLRRAPRKTEPAT